MLFKRLVAGILVLSLVTISVPRKAEAAWPWYAVCAAGIIVISGVAVVSKAVRGQEISLDAELTWTTGIKVKVDDVDIDFGVETMPSVPWPSTVHGHYHHYEQGTYTNTSSTPQTVEWIPQSWHMEMGASGLGGSDALSSYMRVRLRDETNGVMLLDRSVNLYDNGVTSDTSLPSNFSIVVPPMSSVVVGGYFDWAFDGTDNVSPIVPDL
jgi:hypothetical protein